MSQNEAAALLAFSNGVSMLRVALNYNKGTLNITLSGSCVFVLTILKRNRLPGNQNLTGGGGGVCRQKRFSSTYSGISFLKIVKFECTPIVLEISNPSFPTGPMDCTPERPCLSPDHDLTVKRATQNKAFS